MQDILLAYSPMIWGAFAVMCFFIAVFAIRIEIRNGADTIANAITALEMTVQQANHDDRPAYRVNDY
jgi:hypothetical protein